MSVVPGFGESSFSMVIGLPVAFARMQAMALETGEPTRRYVFLSPLISCSTSLKTFLCSSIVMTSPSFLMVVSLAISVLSSNCGRFVMSSFRSVSVKGRPYLVSRYCDRSLPGGVRIMPPLPRRRVLSSMSSSVFASVVLSRMYTALAL